MRVVLYRDQEVYAHDLWHLLKLDFPNFTYSPLSVTSLLQKGLSIEELLGRDRMRRFKGRKKSVTISSMPDPAIVLQYRGK